MSSFDLMNLLSISGVEFDAPPRQETSGQTGGAVRVRDLGDPIWKMTADCSTLLVDQVTAIQAVIGGMGGAAGTFWAWDPKRQGPLADPSGAILGASVARVNSLGSGDARQVSLRGLPAGYVLSRGDYLSWDYTNPVSGSASVALHQVVPATVTANGSGVTSLFQVHPPVRPGVVVGALGAVVRLVRAYAEFRIKPGSFSPRATGGLQASAQIEAVQHIPN